SDGAESESSAEARREASSVASFACSVLGSSSNSTAAAVPASASPGTRVPRQRVQNRRHGLSSTWLGLTRRLTAWASASTSASRSTRGSSTGNASRHSASTSWYSASRSVSAGDSSSDSRSSISSRPSRASSSWSSCRGSKSATGGCFLRSACPRCGQLLHVAWIDVVEIAAELLERVAHPALDGILRRPDGLANLFERQAAELAHDEHFALIIRQVVDRRGHSRADAWGLRRSV